MDTKSKELELLLLQRSQLVDDLSKTNSTFQKTALGFFTALASIIVADTFLNYISPNIVLFLIQVAILFTFFVETILVSGNNQRYYICAIDDYIQEEYGINCLFYQGELSCIHTIGMHDLFPIITNSMGVITALVSIWLTFRLNLLHYFKGNYLYLCFVFLELTWIAVIATYNIIEKRSFISINYSKKPKRYRDCYMYLKYGEKMHIKEKKKAEHKAEIEQSV